MHNQSKKDNMNIKKRLKRRTTPKQQWITTKSFREQIIYLLKKEI